MTDPRRTLTDELNSVLREQSLQAPPPDATINRVLDLAGTAPIKRAPRRRFRPSMPSNLNGWIAAAAVVGLLTVGAIALNTHGANDSKSSSAGVASTGMKGGAASAQNPLARSAAASGLASASPSSADSGFSSAAGTGSGCVAGAATPVTLSVGGTTYELRETDCTGAGPTSSGPNGFASQVQVAVHGKPVAPIVTTLITPEERLQVASISGSESSVVVRAMDPSRTVRDYKFSLAAIAASAANARSDIPAAPVASPSATVPATDAQVTVPRNAPVGYADQVLVARACTATDLAVSATTVPVKSLLADASAAAIAVVNSSVQPCAMSGYPTVRVANASGLSRGSVVVAQQSAFGAGGGLSNSIVPPVIVLAPGGRATAIVESGFTASTRNPPCSSGVTLTVTLPGLATIYALSAATTTCGLQVHPFIAGSSGSD